jgi:hypothetical protein
MSLLGWVLLGLMASEMAGLIALFAVNCMLHARSGRALDFARGRLAVIELPRGLREADTLCREGRRALRAPLRLRLWALDAGRTRVAVRTKPGLIYRFTLRRAAELDHFAAWLVENGGGRVVATGFGNAR